MTKRKKTLHQKNSVRGKKSDIIGKTAKQSKTRTCKQKRKNPKKKTKIQIMALLTF